MKKQIDGTNVTFTFDDGLPSLTLDTSVVSPTCHARAEMHGWSSKLGDAAAIPRKDAKTGAVITVTEEMRYNAVKAMVDHFAGGGEWAAAKATAEQPAIRALATKKGITYAEALALVEALANM